MHLFMACIYAIVEFISVAYNYEYRNKMTNLFYLKNVKCFEIISLDSMKY